jgi:hypothetical protein
MMAVFDGLLLAFMKEDGGLFHLFYADFDPTRIFTRGRSGSAKT